MPVHYTVDPTAVIDQPCEIGEGTVIWHFCHIMQGARIGKNCMLGQNIFVAAGSCIGNGVRIQNNVSVYAGVTVEDDVFLGPSVVFTDVKTPRSFVSRKDARIPTLVRSGASIGANATVVCGVTVGRYALIGAGAVVTKDVPDHAIVYGNPAMQRGWVCRCGAVLVFKNGHAACFECANIYEEVPSGIRVKSPVLVTP